jgi:hypothetical protein
MNPMPSPKPHMNRSGEHTRPRVWRLAPSPAASFLFVEIVRMAARRWRRAGEDLP